MYGRVPTSCWMRERAHWACSEITDSVEAANCSRRERISRRVSSEDFFKSSPEFPKATQALRTRPRHFVRFTGLLRNASLNSASVMAASLRRLGENNDSAAALSLEPQAAGSDRG